MSARGVLTAALLARLKGAIGAGVFDAPPVRAGMPFVVIDEPVLADWSTKTWRGLEGRVSLIFHDGGERPVRLRETMAEAETLAEGTPPALGEGWRLVQLRLVRSRLTRGRGGEGWLGTSEFAVRMYREQA